uniref:Putative sigma-70 region domain containing protein n=1 Tax=viral metagenome TaxID=1070528 RepID=A0A6M3JJ53_9ZZZZ
MHYVDAALDLRRAATRLTDTQREALRLVMAGYTHYEAAARLGVSRRAVGYRLERAIATLRREER